MSLVGFSLGDTKNAALYYNYVVPLTPVYDLVKEYESVEQFLSTCDHERGYAQLKQLEAFLPPMLKGDENNYQEFANLTENIFFTMMWVRRKHIGLKHDDQLRAKKAWREHARLWSKFSEIFRGNECHILASPETIFEDKRGDVEIILHGLDLIDTSKASIDQIIAFRSDTESMYRLRKLRLFARENYAGKPIAFIEDDLHSRLFEYDEARRKWGFECKRAAAAVLLESRLLRALGGGSIVAGALGAPLAAGAVLLAGIAIEAGRATLAVAKTRADSRTTMLEMPVSYISAAKEALGDKSK